MVLNQWNRLLRLWILILPLVGSSQLRAARCDTSNGDLTCNVELIAGVSVTHYRVKGATSSARAWTWLQRQFPSIFGKAPPFNKGVALLVGVANYKHLTRLPNVRNDLLNMRDYLLTQEEFDDVYILQDDDVTNLSVNNLFYGYFARKEVVGEEDRFLFYYSGHGSNKTGVGQMEFSQADPSAFNADATLSANSWRDWSKILNAKQVLFLFDACALGAEIVSKGSEESDAEFLRNLSQDKSRIAFAATRGGEAAHADEDISYFTAEFLRVVQSAKADVNGVGFMTIAGIGELMQAKLHELAEQHDYKWYYTSPTKRDNVQYPGTFVFLNPKVPKDPEARFDELINKGPESPPALRPTPSEQRVYVAGASTPVPRTTDMTNPEFDIFGITGGGSGASVMRTFVPEGTRPAAAEKIHGQPASAEVRVAIRKGYDRLSEAAAKNDFQAYKAVYAADFVSRDGAKVSDAETHFSRVEQVFGMGSLTITFDIKDVIMTAPDTAVVTVIADTKTAFVRGVETDRDTWKHIGDQWLYKETNVLEMHFLD